MEQQPLHILDLPQLYQKPEFSALQTALSELSLQPQGFGQADDTRQFGQQSRVMPEGATRYLTGIIASPLAWIADEDQKEELWSLASQCLSARSGRTGMGNITRKFAISSSSGEINIQLYEPALTEDNLGLKTWSSSYVLARRLHFYVRPTLPVPSSAPDAEPFILELGAGTGLLGLAAAMIWSTTVVMTDLPEIVPNLAKNIEMNALDLSRCGGRGLSEVLDWQDPGSFNMPASAGPACKAATILVADPIYSPDHPKMLVHAVRTWLHRDASARVFLAYPVRDAYQEQIKELNQLLSGIGLAIIESHTESVRDDWDDEVLCCCEVWTWDGHIIQS